MDELVDKARQKQPGLIVVDRAVPGENQNYLTPENTVPKEALPYPWESCIIAGGGWSWTPNATYMTGHDAIHLLVDIVAKGGNLLLNIAPGPEGQWHDGAYQLLIEIGDWMKVNSEAIYETRALAPYKEGNICFTQKKDGSVYLIYLAGKDETIMPSTIKISSFFVEKSGIINLLGLDKQLKWKINGKDLVIEIPENVRNSPPCKHAWAFKISGFNSKMK
jgi:alpha-L-fucosidase